MAQQGNFIQPAPQFPQYQNPQQQYYPNAYPPSPAAHAFIQPHPSPDFQRHAPTQQHDPLARAFMPPPSAVPEDITKRRNLQPQRPQNLWPRELSEEQRQIQDQYTRHSEFTILAGTEKCASKWMLTFPSSSGSSQSILRSTTVIDSSYSNSACYVLRPINALATCPVSAPALAEPCFHFPAYPFHDCPKPTNRSTYACTSIFLYDRRPKL